MTETSADALRRLVEVDDASNRSPVLLHAPHAGTVVPDFCLPSFVISKAELDEERGLLTDHATDHIARLIGGTSLIASRLSRLVVDVERFEGDAEEMNAVGMGALHTHGSHGQPVRTVDAVERASLLTWFRSYGERFGDLVDRIVEQHGRAVIIDVHSYEAQPLPYELHQDDRRPELCIGDDDRHTPLALVDAARAAFRDWDVEMNQPFRGSYVPTRHLGDPRVSSVTLEIRRDRYLLPDGSMDGVAMQDIAGRIRRIVSNLEPSRPKPSPDLPFWGLSPSRVSGTLRAAGLPDPRLRLPQRLSPPCLKHASSRSSTLEPSVGPTFASA